MWRCPIGQNGPAATVEEAGAVLAGVTAACTAVAEAMAEEDSAGAGAALAEVAAAGTAAGIQEIKGEEKEGNIPSFLFFINLFYT